MPRALGSGLQDTAQQGAAASPDVDDPMGVGEVVVLQLTGEESGRLARHERVETGRGPRLPSQLVPERLSVGDLVRDAAVLDRGRQLRPRGPPAVLGPSHGGALHAARRVHAKQVSKLGVCEPAVLRLGQHAERSQAPHQPVHESRICPNSRGHRKRRERAGRQYIGDP